MLALAVAAALAIYGRQQSAAFERLRAEAAARDKANEETLAEAESRTLQARTALYARSIHDAQEALAGGDLGRARAALDDCPDDLRGWEWGWTHHCCARTCRILDVLRWPAKAVGLKTAGEQHCLFAWAADPEGKQVQVRSWSFAGRRQVLWEAGQARPVEVPRAGPIRPIGSAILEGHSVPVVGLDVSPDGTRAVTCAQGRQGDQRIDEVFVWDARTGKLLTRLPAAPAEVFGAVFSPDGSLIAAGSDKGAGRRRRQVKVWNAATGEPVHSFAEAHGPVVFSPAGGRLAGFVTAPADPGGRLPDDALSVPRIWDLAAGKEIQTLQDPDPNLPLCVAFGAAGRRFVAGYRGQDAPERAASPGRAASRCGTPKPGKCWGTSPSQTP